MRTTFLNVCVLCMHTWQIEMYVLTHLLNAMQLVFKEVVKISFRKRKSLHRLYLVQKNLSKNQKMVKPPPEVNTLIYT